MYIHNVLYILLQVYCTYIHTYICTCQDCRVWGKKNKMCKLWITLIGYHRSKNREKRKHTCFPLGLLLFFFTLFIHTYT